MTKKKKQSLWLQRNKKDKYSKLSKKQGFRSRSAYKLLEINEKYKIIKKGENVIDLGSYPGGWSQVLASLLSKSDSKIFGIDQNKVMPIKGVYLIQCKIEDFNKSNRTENNIENIELIISDMAPNAIGHKFTDQSRANMLCFKSLNFVKENLNEGGNFICKYLRGKDEKSFFSELKKNFSKVEIFKPKASRDISTEIYFICLSFNNLQH